LDGVCGGQAVPHHPDKNPIQWYRPIAEDDTVEVFPKDKFQRASPHEKLRMCSWDNVNALYRKKALQDIPFDDVRFGEDMVWAKACLETGGKIGYAKHLKMWHYHHQHIGFTSKRIFYTHFWRYLTFGTLPTPDEQAKWMRTMRWLKTLVIHAKIWNPFRIFYWLRYNHRFHEVSNTTTVEFLNAAASGSNKLNTLYESLGDKSPMATT